MVVGPSLLTIDGYGYFLRPYVSQKIWDKKTTLTGYILLSQNGELIDDDEMFKKAFLTFNSQIWVR